MTLSIESRVPSTTAGKGVLVTVRQQDWWANFRDFVGRLQALSTDQGTPIGKGKFAQRHSTRLLESRNDILAFCSGVGKPRLFGVF